MLTPKQGQILLKIAKSAIKGKTSNFNNDFLKQKRGVFVTLYLKGELRGCIGLPYPIKELGKAVVEASQSAAFNDSRFLPLTKEEIFDIQIEVSVLSKPESCKLRDIKKGDGVILESRNRSALFLPQVWKQLPNKTNFLQQLSLKAFLPKDEYKIAKFQKFKVQVFK